MYGLQASIVYMICRALQCLVHLMPQNFKDFPSSTVFGVPQSYETLQCSFWGMRCTKHCNARKIPTILKFRDLWSQARIAYRISGFCGFFEHYSVWCTPELLIILLLYYCFTLLLHFSITSILYYSITLLIYFSLLLYYCITVEVFLCITVVLYCY